LSASEDSNGLPQCGQAGPRMGEKLTQQEAQKKGMAEFPTVDEQ